MTLTTEADTPSALTPLDLDTDVLAQLVEKKVTCPFLGPAVERRILGVYGSAQCPLARFDEIVSLGDSGGGDLGSRVLKIFARGNHSWMPGLDGRMTVRVPEGMMSLDLAGSRGAHPGHSGITIPSCWNRSRH
jgi:hypothetical protein